MNTAAGNAGRSRRKSTTTAATKRDRISAGVGGVGGGTALISIADHLGTATWPGLMLMYCSPAVAVVFGAAIAQISFWADRTRERSVTKWALRTITKQIEDPDITPEHKAYLVAKRQEVEKAIAENHLERVRSLW